LRPIGEITCSRGLTLVWPAERERLLDIITIDRGFDTFRTASGGRFTSHLA
jgi:hypothetical protein